LKFNFYTGSSSAAVVLHDLELLHLDLYPCLKALLRDDASGEHRLLVLATVNAVSGEVVAPDLGDLLEPFDCIAAAAAP